ncbi:hypothetical protein VNO77_46279 [Canavalia gladiata]|uniref:Uncharacterized protein n=1 Tax=Canavalia gladiata TaxID=3824 RepID=A0AAN9JFY8_CANGL
MQSLLRVSSLDQDRMRQKRRLPYKGDQGASLLVPESGLPIPNDFPLSSSSSIFVDRMGPNKLSTNVEPAANKAEVPPESEAIEEWQGPITGGSSNFMPQKRRKVYALVLRQTGLTKERVDPLRVAFIPAPKRLQKWKKLQQAMPIRAESVLAAVFFLNQKSHLLIT